MNLGQVKLTTVQIHVGQYDRNEISNRNEFSMQVVNSRSEFCAVSSESYLVHMCVANIIEKTNTKTN